MTQDPSRNRRVLLASRPDGAPTRADFHMDEQPVTQPGDGEVLLRTLFLSLDPYMRGRMSDGPSYAAPVALGAVMVGATVALVVASRHADYAPGELVLAYGGWQDYAISDGRDLTRIDRAMQPPSLALGVLGMPGFTAYMGLTDIGQPLAGETVVVGAASGAVGSVVGQIARIIGCHVVGIAGGPRKCTYVVEELGFDACVDRLGNDLPAKLAAACPQGIDVYFENTGGAVFDAVLPLLNPRGRVPVCGLISQYNARELLPAPDRLGLLMRNVLTRRLRIQGFIISEDYPTRFAEFLGPMRAWVEQGRIRYREDIVEGLENAAQAFIGMLDGRNFGKLVVRVAAP